jgi:hypothetical protein
MDEYFEQLKYLYTRPHSSWLGQIHAYLTNLTMPEIATHYTRAKEEDRAKNVIKKLVYPDYQKFSETMMDDRGTITYYYESKDPRKARGVYSINVYVRKEANFGNYYSKFWRGIHAYTEMMRKGHNFTGWSLVIYTDYYTARLLELVYDYHYHKRLPTSVSLAVVEWVDHREANAENFEQLDNALLRLLRYRAFVDFPKKPVAVRDADTIFFKDYRDFTDEEVEASEFTYWREFAKQPQTFSVSSQKEYTNDFHIDILCNNFKVIPGSFAGFVSSKGDENWKKLWSDCMKYYINRKHVTATDNAFIYIGKDEQFLLFCVIPTLFDKIYFFHMEYTNKVQLTGYPPNGKGFRLMSPEYVKSVFADPSYHQVLKHLFKEQIERYDATCRPTRHNRI